MSRLIKDNKDIPEILTIEDIDYTLDFKIPLLYDAGGNVTLSTTIRQVYEYALLQCTHDEMRRLLGVSQDTWTRRLKESQVLADVINIAREEGKKSLRRVQYQQAMKGNTAILIWLGKNWLNQSDKLDTRTINVDLTADEYRERLKELSTEELEVLAKISEKPALKS